MLQQTVTAGEKNWLILERRNGQKPLKITFDDNPIALKIDFENKNSLKVELPVFQEPRIYYSIIVIGEGQEQVFSFAVVPGDRRRASFDQIHFKQ